MKLKRNALLLSLAGILAVGSSLVYAHNQNVKATNTNNQQFENTLSLEDIHNHHDGINLFTTFRGTVVQIFEPFTNEEDETFYTIEVESEDQGLAHISLSEDDVVIFGARNVEESHLGSINDIVVGDELIVHYEALSPSPLIYPKRINKVSAVLVVIDEYPVNIHVDVYSSFMSKTSMAGDNEIASVDNRYRLPKTTDHILDKGHIVVLDRNNEVYNGTLENKKLAILYTVTTRDRMPFLGNSKVYVLGEAEEVAGFDMVMEYYDLRAN